jgi:hypothetical protein
MRTRTPVRARRAVKSVTRKPVLRVQYATAVGLSCRNLLWSLGKVGNVPCQPTLACFSHLKGHSTFALAVRHHPSVAPGLPAFYILEASK